MCVPYLLATLLLLPHAASAADADPLVPSGSAPDGQGSLHLDSAILGPPGPSVAVWGLYARRPLLFDTAEGEVVGVREVVGVPVQLGWTLLDRARIDLLVPAYGWVDAPYAGYAGAALGEVQLSAVIDLVRPSAAVHFGIKPTLALPTATGDAPVRRGAHGGLAAILSGQLDIGFGYTAVAGFTGAAGEILGDAVLGSTVDLGAGAWWRLGDHWRLGGEVVGALGLSGPTRRSNHHLSGHLFAQVVLPSGFGLLVGGGTGLVPGVGAPKNRVMVALSWSRRLPDRDKDGLLDRDDTCPTDPEDPDGFEDDDGCPEYDNDGDGILDPIDDCPLEAEDLDGYADRDGCPDLDNDADEVLDLDDLCPDSPGEAAMDGCPNGDGDGLADHEDRCPVEPGATLLEGCPDRDADGLPDLDDACPDEAGPAELFGCPDRDGDGVPDSRDLCPDEPGPEGEDLGVADGCPKRVVITAEQVRLDEKVHFATGSDRIEPDSFPLLREVAWVLAEHPELALIEVAGHTDSRGSESLNRRLSADRAAAVRAFLLAEGIAPERLQSSGYGPDEPIDTNRTDAGRAANRRVELRVIRRSE